jgi:uncharacterized protein YcfJ
MKQSVIFAAMGLAAFGVSAQETGTVVSSTPVVRQVAVCGQGYVARPGPTTGGGAVIGAITGAAIGSTVGGGFGQAAAIGIGAVAGGAVGNSIEANNNARMVPTCATPVSYENRAVGYNVTYEYNGRQYQAQLPSDPGPTIRLRVTPAGEVRPMMRMYRSGPVAAGAPVTAPPVQYAQQQPQMQYQQPQMQYQQPQMQHQQPMAMPEPARSYGEAVPPEQERQGTNTSATESGNAAMMGYGYGYAGYPGYGYPAYGYGYPAYGYGYPAYGYGYGYPAVYGAAVIPAYRPFYRPWVGYRPWGGYYRPWGYRPFGAVSFGFGYRGRWR